MNMILDELKEIAVDRRVLATNFTDVVPDCCDGDADVKTELMTRHPLYNWLINTELSRKVRNDINRDGKCFLFEGNDGYEIKVPKTFWSLEPTDTSEECCWVPFNFAKCEGTVPVKRVCLKDCDSIDHELLGGFQKVDYDYGGVTRAGETFWETKKRIARLSMAFLTVQNVILGRDSQTTATLKPFHGLFEVMSNPAVITLGGTNVLGTFDSLWCRMVLLGIENGIIAVNPIIKATLQSIIRPDQYNRLPDGWRVNGDELFFHEMRVIADRFVPVDFTNGTGEAWILDGASVGAWLATDLMVADRFIKESGHKEETLANGCGSSCTYYYNFGSTFNNNANRIARIVDIPISANCGLSTGDLSGVIMPTTLIPYI